MSHKSEKRLTKTYQASLDKLFDVAPKPPGRGSIVEKENAYVLGIVSATGKPQPTGFKRKDDDSYHTDYDFYIDQKGPCVQMVGKEDINLSTKEKTKLDERLKKEQKATSSSIAGHGE